MADSQKGGTVSHYYDKIGGGTVKLTADLKGGDMIQFKGKKTDFTQPVESIQFEHQDIQEAKTGQDVGVKVMSKVCEGDEIFLMA